MRAGPPLMAIEDENLAVEVADAAQEEIIEARWSVWPECPHHPNGLHPQLTEEGGSWICRVGDHRVGEIGKLGEM